MDGITYYTTDALKWGTGKGSRLTSLEVDLNFWELYTRLKVIEDNPPLPVSIQDFTVIGSQWEINLTDGSNLGPFTLPIATFELRGEWVNEMLYHELDMFTVAGRGLYLVRIEHTTPAAPAVFDPDAEDGSGNKLYLLLFGEDTYIYDIGFFFPGQPGIGIDDGEAMAGFTFDRDVTLPADLPGSVARLKSAPTAAMDFVIMVNDDEVGSVHFNIGSTTGLFTFDDPVECASGDTLTILKPTDGIDTTARQFSVTIKGQRVFES